MLTHNHPERSSLILSIVGINDIRLSYDSGIRPVRSGYEPWLNLRIVGRGLQPSPESYSLALGFPSAEPHIHVS